MKIRIKNKLILHSTPPWILEWIKDEFTILNPKWVENEKHGRWNNNTPKHLKFYSIAGKKVSVPIGAGIGLHMKCIASKVIPKYYDQRTEVPIDIGFKGKLKDFQRDALLDLNDHTVSTIEAPTGAGKTVMGIGKICELKQKTLILVHTKELAHQWIERIRGFTDVTGDRDIGLIGDGQNVIGKKITIGMVQTCYKCTKELENEFGMVICDEAHRAPSNTFIKVLSKLNCKYRLGLTATPYRRDKLNDLITWYCGPIRHSVDKKMLVDEGHILQPQFVMKYTNFSPKCDPVNEYTKMISELANDMDRNKQIAMDIVHACKDPKVNCLVISDRKYHCHLLAEYILNIGWVKPLVLTGDTPIDERKTITKLIGNGSNLLIAIGQLIGEGFDCKNLNTMFITTPIKFAGRITQYIGRIMRSSDGKQKPLVIDYIDWQVPTLERSAFARVKVYGRKNVIFDTKGKENVIYDSSSRMAKGISKTTKVRTKKRHP